MQIHRNKAALSGCTSNEIIVSELTTAACERRLANA